MDDQREPNKPPQPSTATSTKEDGDQAPALHSSGKPGGSSTSISAQQGRHLVDSPPTTSIGLSDAPDSRPTPTSGFLGSLAHDLLTDLFGQPSSKPDFQSRDTPSQAASSLAQTPSSAKTSDQVNEPSTLPAQTTTTTSNSGGGGQPAPTSAPNGASDDQNERHSYFEGLARFPIGFGFGWSG